MYSISARASMIHLFMVATARPSESASLFSAFWSEFVHDLLVMLGFLGQHFLLHWLLII